jgi:hypothetical protein
MKDNHLKLAVAAFALGTSLLAAQEVRRDLFPVFPGNPEVRTNTAPSQMGAVIFIRYTQAPVQVVAAGAPASDSGRRFRPGPERCWRR